MIHRIDRLHRTPPCRTGAPGIEVSGTNVHRAGRYVATAASALPAAPRPTCQALAAACACAGILAGMTTMPVLAQTAPQPAVAPVVATGGTSAARRQIDIAAQPLGEALNAFARQTRLELIVRPALVAGKNAPAVSGSLTPQQALDRLLAGSGLSAAIDDGAVVVRPIAGVSQVDPATLPTVTVNARAAVGATTEGTGSYTTRQTGAGTRMALSLRETPQSVSVIGRQQIEDQNLMTLVDVLRQTPGIVADRLDERVNFSARGFSLSTMIDGVPTLAFNTIAGEASMISTAIYDRVEVVRGAAGLLNGVGSPGGSINLVRKRPTTDFSGHVAAGAGSWNRYTTEADLGGSLNAAGTLRGRVVASHTAGNGFVDAKRKTEDVFYGIVEADLAPGTLLAAGLEYQKTATDGASFGQSPLFYTDRSRTGLPVWFNSSTPWSVWNMTTKRAFLNLAQRIGADWRVKVDAAYAENDRVRYSGDTWLYPSTINPDGLGGVAQVANNPAESTNKSIDVYATGPFDLLGRMHRATLGMNINKYRYDYGNDSALANVFDRRPVNIFDLGAIAKPDFTYPLNRLGGETEEKALYGAVQIKPLDPLAILLGGRLSWYKNAPWTRFWTNGTNGAPNIGTQVKEDAVFTPYAGAVLDLSRELSVYASYTDIFQPNTVRDVNNRILDPKRGTNLEAGVKGEHFGGKLNTSLAVFQTQEDNVAVTDTGAALLPDGSAPSRAVKGARSRGFEIGVSGELARGWQLMGGYTYHAKRDSKEVLLNPTYPRRLLRIATSYRLPGAWNRLTVGGNLAYQSDIYYDESYGLGRATQGGMTLIGLMARVDLTPQLSASLNIDNLTDKRYYTGLGGYNGYTYGDPRNAWLKMSYRF